MAELLQREERCDGRTAHLEEVRVPIEVRRCDAHGVHARAADLQWGRGGGVVEGGRLRRPRSLIRAAANPSSPPPLPTCSWILSETKAMFESAQMASSRRRGLAGCSAMSSPTASTPPLATMRVTDDSPFLSGSLSQARLAIDWTHIWARRGRDLLRSSASAESARGG